MTRAGARGRHLVLPTRGAHFQFPRRFSPASILPADIKAASCLEKSNLSKKKEKEKKADLHIK